LVVGRRLVVPEEFWVQLRAGVPVTTAARAAGFSADTAWRRLAEIGGSAALGVEHLGTGRPWGGRKSETVRDVFWDSLRRGDTVAAAARAAGVSKATGRNWLIKAGGVRPRANNPDLEATVTTGSGPLSFVDRCRIEDLARGGYNPCRIAALLGRARSTITRELARGRPHDGARYRAVIAQAQIERNRRRAGRCPKLVPGGRLFVEVVERLARKHSPAQIAGRLKADFPDDPEMWVSHETIYQGLYVQPRGELATQVKEALRTGRTRRKPQGRQSPPKLRGMVNIAERPAEAADRAVPGHWEGDLIIGAHSGSAIGTLVERTTGFVLLLHLPHDHTAATVAAAMTTAIGQLPAQLWRSLTWDQGSEMALHTQITEQTGLPIYFCDPHSPWQRGSNENTNGLLRQYFPKSTDLSFYGPGMLDQVAAELNARPRKRHGFATPAEKLEQLLSEPTESVASTA
jgi:IS30 family transposase